MPKGDSLYDQQQRVQIYYPSGYATARAAQQQQQHNHQENDINSECGASVEPRRIRRPFEHMEHVYDVPHRMRNKQIVNIIKHNTDRLIIKLWTIGLCYELLVYVMNYWFMLSIIDWFICLSPGTQWHKGCQLFTVMVTGGH